MYVCACDRPPEGRLCLRRRGRTRRDCADRRSTSIVRRSFFPKICPCRHCRQRAAVLRCQLSKRGSAWLIRSESPTAISRPSHQAMR